MKVEVGEGNFILGHGLVVLYAVVNEAVAPQYFIRQVGRPHLKALKTLVLVQKE